MNANFNMLDKSGKIRIIIFSIITVIAALIAIYSAGFLYGVTTNPPLNAEDIMNENIDFDGENFNWFFAMMAFGVNIVMIVYIVVFSIVISLIVDLLAYGLFRAIAFRKTDFVSETEYVLARWVMTVILIVNIVISLFMVHFDFVFLFSIEGPFIFFLVWPTFFMWFFGYFFYIYPLKHKRQK